ncbi:cyclin-I [Pitangus sulphuratus]|nr:cyclin-I [Pitangus sulphuratus]
MEGTDISLSSSKTALPWIAEISSKFQFYPERFALVTSIFNRLLASVKAQLKYLQCIAISCLVLAAKPVKRMRSVIPSVQTLVVQSSCKCSPAEILRMERIILDKLQWDLYTATPMDFLNIFHAVGMSNKPHPTQLPQRNPSLHVALLTRQLQHWMASHQLVQLRGSTLVLVIITLELERQAPGWLCVTTDLLKKAQLESDSTIAPNQMKALPKKLDWLASENTGKFKTVIKAAAKAVPWLSSA